MTRRSRRATLDPIYPRGRADCTHDPEPHVVYDRLAAGYRASLRCGCGEVDVVSERLHDDSAGADAEARRMLTGRTTK